MCLITLGHWHLSFSPIFQETVDKRTYLTVGNVTKDDSGTFLCTANNGIGEPATAEAHLIVKCKSTDPELWIGDTSHLN